MTFYYFILIIYVISGFCIFPLQAICDVIKKEHLPGVLVQLGEMKWFWRLVYVTFGVCHGILAFLILGYWAK